MRARKGIGFAAALPVIAAFLITYPFYLAIGFPDVRERSRGAPPPMVLAGVGRAPVSGLLLRRHRIHWLSLACIAALALAAACGSSCCPRVLLTDLAFLAIIPAVILGGFFDSIYPVYLGQKLVTLGHVTSDSDGVLPLMLERRVAETGFTFAPTRAEWRIGALHFLYFLPVGAALGFALTCIQTAEHRAVLEDRGHVSRLSVGDRLFRGVLLPRRAAAVDRRLDCEPRGRAGDHIAHFRRRTPRLPRLPVSQLAVGVGGGHTRMVLRPCAQSGREHRREHGDARSGSGGMAGVFRVTM